MRRWHNAWEQWVLVETRDIRWHLVDYQAGDEGFDPGQPDISNVWPEQAFLGQNEFSALFNAGRVEVSWTLKQWRRFVLRMQAYVPKKPTPDGWRLFMLRMPAHVPKKPTPEPPNSDTEPESENTLASSKNGADSELADGELAGW